MLYSYFFYKFQSFKILINDEIKDRNDFYNHLRKIEEIRKEQVNVEIFFQDLNHRMYILENAGVSMPQEDMTYILYMKNDWMMLQQIATEKKMYLEKAKVIWSHAVKINIELFLNTINIFLENYEQDWSKKIKDDLNLGLIFINVCIKLIF